MLPKETLDKIQQLVTASGGKVVENADGEPCILVPSGYGLQSLKPFFPPKRIEQGVVLRELTSFSDYVNRFKTSDTMLFMTGTRDTLEVTAELDYHKPAPELTPAYCKHTATYMAQKTPEWQLWLANNAQPKSQTEFATFLEDNAKLFVDPNGADLIELVKSIEATSNASFASMIKTENGSVRCSYVEQVEIRGSSQAKDGFVEIPKTIKAGISMFEGMDTYGVTARLKTRLSSGKLSMWYETIALADIVRDNMKTAIATIQEKTGILPLLGNTH